MAGMRWVLRKTVDGKRLYKSWSGEWVEDQAEAETFGLVEDATFYIRYNRLNRLEIKIIRVA